MSTSAEVHATELQYLASLLIGLGTGGVVGASTLGVAMFTLIAPHGQLREFTAVVPVVNCCANIATVSNYFRHAELTFCYRMWPFLFVGICFGTLILPHFAEDQLRRTTSVVYALVLAQQLASKVRERRPKRDTAADAADAAKRCRDERVTFYTSLPVMAFVSVLCGVLTVICNNSGPIFNVYLLSAGLSMDQFVATRAVLMAGKNIAKVAARALSGGLPSSLLAHGLKLGAGTVAGIFLAKPIKKRTSANFYKYFTWGVLAYTSVQMWRSANAAAKSAANLGPASWNGLAAAGPDAAKKTDAPGHRSENHRHPADSHLAPAPRAKRPTQLTPGATDNLGAEDEDPAESPPSPPSTATEPPLAITAGESRADASSVDH